MDRLKVAAVSSDPKRPFAHLLPIVQRLISCGNESTTGKIFYSTQDGWVCDLRNPIDFDVISRHFDLPESIELVVGNDSIFCRRSWIEIKGSVGRD